MSSVRELVGVGIISCINSIKVQVQDIKSTKKRGSTNKEYSHNLNIFFKKNYCVGIKTKKDYL